jgi:hypothetical protein
MRALVRALDLYGGAKPLARQLGITTPALHAMLARVVDVPEATFLQVVDLLVSWDVAALSEHIAARNGEGPAQSQPEIRAKVRG